VKAKEEKAWQIFIRQGIALTNAVAVSLIAR
jgi:hypothetical protein